MSLTHQDTPRGPVLRLPWALLMVPVFFAGFLAVLVFIAAVQGLLALQEARERLRRWALIGGLLVALAVVAPGAEGAGR